MLYSTEFTALQAVLGDMYVYIHTSRLLTLEALEDCPLLRVTGLNFCPEVPSLEASADKDGCGIDRY